MAQRRRKKENSRYVELLRLFGGNDSTLKMYKLSSRGGGGGVLLQKNYDRGVRVEP